MDRKKDYALGVRLTPLDEVGFEYETEDIEETLDKTEMERVVERAKFIEEEMRRPEKTKFRDFHDERLYYIREIKNALEKIEDYGMGIPENYIPMSEVEPILDQIKTNLRLIIDSLDEDKHMVVLGYLWELEDVLGAIEGERIGIDEVGIAPLERDEIVLRPQPLTLALQDVYTVIDAYEDYKKAFRKGTEESLQYGYYAGAISEEISYLSSHGVKEKVSSLLDTIKSYRESYGIELKRDDILAEDYFGDYYIGETGFTTNQLLERLRRRYDKEDVSREFVQEYGDEYIRFDIWREEQSW